MKHTASQDHRSTPDPSTGPTLVHRPGQAWIALWNPNERHATIVACSPTPHDIGTLVHVCDSPGGSNPQLTGTITRWTGTITLDSTTPPTDPEGKTSLTGLSQLPIHTDEFRANNQA